MDVTRIKKYDSLWENQRPVKYFDYISEKYNDIHKQLYNDALSKLINDIYQNYGFDNIEDFLKSVKIIEIKNEEYWEPSSVIVKYIKKDKDVNNNKIVKGLFYTYDLTPYWNTFQYKNFDKHIGECTDIKDEICDPEILYIDYIKGKAKIESRLNDIVYNKDISVIQKGDIYSEELYINK
jgi:hypothetical protein